MTLGHVQTILVPHDQRYGFGPFDSSCIPPVVPQGGRGAATRPIAKKFPWHLRPPDNEQG
jgi:hypothetical protein